MKQVEYVTLKFILALYHPFAENTPLLRFLLNFIAFSLQWQHHIICGESSIFTLKLNLVLKMAKGKNSDCSSNNRNRNIQGVCRDSYIYPIELYHAFAYYLCFVPFRLKKSNTGCFIIKSWQIQKVIFGGIHIDMYTYNLKIQL